MGILDFSCFIFVLTGGTECWSHVKTAIERFCGSSRRFTRNRSQSVQGHNLAPTREQMEAGALLWSDSLYWITIVFEKSLQSLPDSIFSLMLYSSTSATIWVTVRYQKTRDKTYHSIEFLFQEDKFGAIPCKEIHLIRRDRLPRWNNSDRAKLTRLLIPAPYC